MTSGQEDSDNPGGSGTTPAAGKGGKNGVNGGQTSADFVRKLYNMLEDPQYSRLVRWGVDGTTFVVINTDKFTQFILPQNFKHSNFASFVRQLNKYDFHKIRQDEDREALYGRGCWEFFHPKFRPDNKDNIDSIKRKAPAPRRQQAQQEQAAVQQVMDGMAAENTQLRDQMLSFQNESNHHTRVLVEQLGRLSKIVTRQGQALDELSNWHVERWFSHKDGSNVNDNELPRRLRQCRALVDNVFRELANDVEKLNPLYEKYSNNSEYKQANVLVSAPADPFATTNPEGSRDERRDGLVNGQLPERKKDIWGEKKPCILLVEDEAIAAKIAKKRLHKYCCQYEYAENGPDAVRMVNEHPTKFDLILMDIQLPGFGGIEATALIRVENHPRMPIIAMTGSRRQDDLITYLKHGMDDLLPKPYTHDLFEAMLRKHLPALLYNADPDGNPTSATASATPGGIDRRPLATVQTPLISVNTNLVKYDQTPTHTPSGSINWGHTPTSQGQMPGASPVVVTPNGNSTMMCPSPRLPTNPGMMGAMHQNHISAMNMSTMSMSNGVIPAYSSLSTADLAAGNHMANGMMDGIDSSYTMSPTHYMALNMPPTMARTMQAMNMSRSTPNMVRNVQTNTGYNGMAGEGLDFGDERPEKRPRLFPPGGYPP